MALLVPTSPGLEMISFFEVEDGDNDAEIFSENELFSAALLLLSSSTSVPLELVTD